MRCRRESSPRDTQAAGAGARLRDAVVLTRRAGRRSARCCSSSLASRRGFCAPRRRSGAASRRRASWPRRSPPVAAELSAIVVRLLRRWRSYGRHGLIVPLLAHSLAPQPDSLGILRILVVTAVAPHDKRGAEQRRNRPVTSHRFTPCTEGLREPSSPKSKSPSGAPVPRDCQRKSGIGGD